MYWALQLRGVMRHFFFPPHFTAGAQEIKEDRVSAELRSQGRAGSRSHMLHCPCSLCQRGRKSQCGKSQCGVGRPGSLTDIDGSFVFSSTRFCLWKGEISCQINSQGFWAVKLVRLVVQIRKGEPPGAGSRFPGRVLLLFGRLGKTTCPVPARAQMQVFTKDSPEEPQAYRLWKGCGGKAYTVVPMHVPKVAELLPGTFWRRLLLVWRTEVLLLPFNFCLSFRSTR